MWSQQERQKIFTVSGGVVNHFCKVPPANGGNVGRGKTRQRRSRSRQEGEKCRQKR
ncbi:hypothetical protein DVDV_3738 [Desulfovibrio sp. DV]|nr:hypothetical protein DVDV_3738 [Desulfovibrio sp. DV]